MAVLIFLGVGLVMRRGLRPIEVMASQADRITAGNLTDRVDPAEAITAREAGDSVVVEVSDNGPGVPADRLPRIFDRFYRAGTPARRPGSGLGLAIVTEIAAAHDGTVTAAAVWPRGLRVTLAVPAWRSAESMDTRDDQLERAEAIRVGPGRRSGPEILTTTELLQVWARVSHWA